MIRNFTVGFSLLTMALSLAAQQYSAALSDNENAFDAPIPGFTGPGGEGKSNTSGYESPDGETSVNPIFLGWASDVAEYYGADSTDLVTGDPTLAAPWNETSWILGPVTGDLFQITSLGDLNSVDIAAGDSPGYITLTFDKPIQNFTGADFAVFENGGISESNQGGAGIGGIFAELAYVEVSSNGVDFARFPSISNTDGAVGRYGSIDPTLVYNLAGKHVNGFGDSWGTPFDLEDLADDELVAQGKLDLNAITHVRMVDIPGDGSFLDSLGNPIYDAWITYDSGGADIEAVGAIGQSLTYDEWDNERGLLPDNDDDGDGWTNFAEYAFRLDPETPDSAAVTRAELDGTSNPQFVFPRDERNADVVYVIEYQDGALDGTWLEAARFGPLTASTVDSAVIESVTTVNQSPQASLGVLQEVYLQIAEPANPADGRFVRLRLEAIAE
ncbi:hypothetical protein [Cerasicoccus maritimus]|uniref:hypothetical protein n=1 Tax=Cerasicoccus maritimus TaxID=490089 RepID=UPI0028525C53|nr:hypothetical protein [Cerasicoccus maritimus]